MLPPKNASGELTLVTDDGYTLRGRVKGFQIVASDPYAGGIIFYGYDTKTNYNPLIRYFFNGEFTLENGTAYTIEQNFIEVIKTVAVKGMAKALPDATRARAGVPDGAKFTCTYSSEDDRTTFEWTEKIINDSK